MADLEQGPKVKEYRVWWIPQVPGTPFVVDVDDLGEAYRLTDTLAQYDLFQYRERIKPDYSNAGGVMRWREEEGEYEHLEDDEIEELLENRYDSFVLD